MLVYLKVNSKTNIIEDIIDYAFENYIPVEINNIPNGINGGWFKYESGIIVEYPELKQIPELDLVQQIQLLKAENELIKKALDDLILGV